MADGVIYTDVATYEAATREDLKKIIKNGGFFTIKERDYCYTREILINTDHIISITVEKTEHPEEE